MHAHNLVAPASMTRNVDMASEKTLLHPGGHVHMLLMYLLTTIGQTELSGHKSSTVAACCSRKAQATTHILEDLAATVQQ